MLIFGKLRSGNRNSKGTIGCMIIDHEYMYRSIKEKRRERERIRLSRCFSWNLFVQATCSSVTTITNFFAVTIHEIIIIIMIIKRGHSAWIAKTILSLSFTGFDRSFQFFFLFSTILFFPYSFYFILSFFFIQSLIHGNSIRTALRFFSSPFSRTN